MQESSYIPAVYKSELAALSGKLFRLRSTDCEVNFKRSYLGFQLALESFYGRLANPNEPAWKDGNYEEKDDDGMWHTASFDVRRVQTLKIPETVTDEETGNTVPLEVRANGGRILPSGVLHGRQKFAGPDLKPWTPGNYEVCVVTTWRKFGKGRQAEDAEWIECDYNTIRAYHLPDERGKPSNDNPEKVTTFHVAFKEPIALQRKDKEGQPVTKHETVVEIEAPHYLALGLQQKIADKSEDGGNPLHYWLAFAYDATKTDNALKWTVKATKMTDDEIATLAADALGGSMLDLDPAFEEELNAEEVIS